MSKSSKGLKEHIMKLGTEFLPSPGGAPSALFFHKVPVPEALSKMTQNTKQKK